MKPNTDDGLKSQLAALKRRETSSLIWEPTPAPSEAKPPVTISIEHEIIGLIERPIDPTETHREGNERKERELCTLLDRLTDLEAHTMRRRLAAARSNDDLVVAFGRLSIDRRARIIAFIEDTRRRHAMHGRR